MFDVIPRIHGIYLYPHPIFSRTFFSYIIKINRNYYTIGEWPHKKWTPTSDTVSRTHTPPMRHAVYLKSKPKLNPSSIWILPWPYPLRPNPKSISLISSLFFFLEVSFSCITSSAPVSFYMYMTLYLFLFSLLQNFNLFLLN